MTIIQRIFALYRDRDYFRQLFKIAIPIALQNFITASLNMIGVMMLGQLGEVSLASAGLANQVFFLFSLLMFGIASGAAIFTAQLWGKKDIASLRKVLGLCLALGLAASGIFLFLAEVLPAQILGIYSKDQQVIALGSEYLRIFGWSFVFFAVSFSYASVMRSIGEVKLPLAVSVSALSLNTLLAYALIFGKFGLPELGVRGAAIAGLIARIIECAALLIFIYARRSPAAATLHELFDLDAQFAWKVLKPVLPVALNEFLWSMGITTYNVVYARIGTDSIAAVNIVGTIDMLAMVIFMGISSATAVLVGNRIGAGQEKEAFRYSARSLGLGVAGAIVMGGIITLSADAVLSLYKVSPAVIQSARNVLTIVSLLFWLRVSNMIMIVGILRGGGDTRYSLIIDGYIIWFVGVPAAFIGAFVFHLPIHWVYLLVMSEEFTKWALGLRRFFSRKWIHNLAQTVSI